MDATLFYCITVAKEKSRAAYKQWCRFHSAVENFDLAVDTLLKIFILHGFASTVL